MSNKILIVEDEESLREIIIEILSDDGWECIQAVNGQIGLNIMTSPEGQDVVAILSDIKMPAMDGLTMIRRLRESGVEVPVVFLSAYGDKEKAVEAMKWGAFDFHDKPFHREKLVKTVTAAAELGRKLKSIESQIDDFLNLTNVGSDTVVEKRDNLKALIMEKVESDLRFRNTPKKVG